MNELMNTNVDFTMSSLDFLKTVINPARVAAGEKPHKPNKFNLKIEDELLDELPVVKKIPHPYNPSQQVTYYNLNMDQMLLVCMRESKAVRKAVLAKLKELQQTHQPQLIGKIESIDEVAALKKEIMRLKAQIWFAEEMAAGERRINDIVCSKKSKERKINELNDLAHQNWRMRCEELQERINHEATIEALAEKKSCVRMRFRG